MYRKFFKRIFDIIGSTIGLILTSPVLLAVSVLLIIANHGSPFFYQFRPGKNGKLFRIIKFKTMNDKRDKNGELLPDIERIYPIGKLIRSTSIDELPQMINILLGHMSFVGPRPLLKEYLPLYTTEQTRRHEVRPGIAGWAQVNGRNAISWTKKFEYDLWYVDRISFKLDIKIMWMTLKKVIIRDGINSDKNITMVPFDVYYQQSQAVRNQNYNTASEG